MFFVGLRVVECLLVGQEAVGSNFKGSGVDVCLLFGRRVFRHSLKIPGVAVDVAVADAKHLLRWFSPIDFLRLIEKDFFGVKSWSPWGRLKIAKIFGMSYLFGNLRFRGIRLCYPFFTKTPMKAVKGCQRSTFFGHWSGQMRWQNEALLMLINLTLVANLERLLKGFKTAVRFSLNKISSLCYY